MLFFKFWHNVRNPYEVVHDRAGCFEKDFFTPKLAGNGPKIGFFKFIEKFSLSFFSKFVP